MTSAVLQFVLSAAVIVFAGTFLTRAADRIAEQTGWGRLLVGGLFLAGATSLPELTVGISAIRQGMPNLAVGDLIGSSLFNLLILAVLDLSHHSKRRMFSHAAANHAISATMSSTLYLLAAMDILFGARFGSVTFGGLGVGSAGILVAYLLGIRLIFHDQSAALAAAAQKKREARRERRKLVRPLVIYCISALAVMIAAPFLSAAAGHIANISGLGKTFLGTTAVALCTSLPEMVTSYAAVRIGAFDLALGNIFGSNSFNLLLLVPLDWAQPGSLLSMVSTAHAFTCLATVLITAIVVMGQLYQAERRIFFVEPDAMLVIVLVVAALAVIYWLR
jgi:cation:H+ antiporter